MLLASFLGFPALTCYLSRTITDMNLHGRVAIVTGATKGVGRGVGCELARYGARVFVTGRSAPRGFVGSGHTQTEKEAPSIRRPGCHSVDRLDCRQDTKRFQQEISQDERHIRAWRTRGRSLMTASFTRPRFALSSPANEAGGIMATAG